MNKYTERFVSSSFYNTQFISYGLKILNSSNNYLRTPTKGGASISTGSSPPQPLIINNEAILRTVEQTSLKTIYKPINKDDTQNVIKSLDKIQHQTIDTTASKYTKIQIIGKKENFVNNNDEIITNIKLKNCFVLLKRIDESKLKNGFYSLNDDESKNNNCKTPLIKHKSSTAQQKSARKLKAKSKTFPTPSSSKINNNEPIDAIISLNSVGSTVNQSNVSKKSSRSRMRTTSLNDNYLQIPSPAELLRKYSSIKGHVCEMDKLFKGSSVTLTQCLECENLRKCPEAFYDRSLPINTITNGNFSH